MSTAYGLQRDTRFLRATLRRVVNPHALTAEEIRACWFDAIFAACRRVDRARHSARRARPPVFETTPAMERRARRAIFDLLVASEVVLAPAAAKPSHGLAREWVHRYLTGDSAPFTGEGAAE